MSAAGAMTMPVNDAPTLPRVVMPLLLTAAALIAALFVGRAVQPVLNLPLNSLRIDGALTHLSSAQIVAAAALPPQLHLFDADLRSLRARVEALPWVAHARVSRVWPDTLEIRVWERVPAARWGDAGLLDTEGVAFAPDAIDLQPPAIQKLPKLSGPAQRELDVMNTYRALNQKLGASEFAPTGLVLDARGEWRMTTARGIELRFGDGDPLAHVPLLLGTVSHNLSAYLEQIAYIDLRYSNGFSVGWINGGDCDPLRRTSAKNKAVAPTQSCGGSATGMLSSASADSAATAADEPAIANPKSAVSAISAAPSGASAAKAAAPAPVAIPKTHSPQIAPAAAKEKHK
jgi:cell division protein FtsQ